MTMDTFHQYLNVFLKFGGMALIVALFKNIAARIPQNTAIHSGHATAAVIMSTAVDTGERLIKGFMTGPYLESIIQAVAGGQPLPVALSAQLPAMVQALRTALGPKATTILDTVLGASAGQAQLESVIVDAVHDYLARHQKSPAPAARPPLPPPPTLPAGAVVPALAPKAG